MSGHFREPVVERAMTLADIDDLIERHASRGLRLTTLGGHWLGHQGDPTAIVGALLRRARFGLLVRELAAECPDKPLDAAVAQIDARQQRER